MAQCAHFGVCGIAADTIPEGGHCILHAQNPDKDREAFAEALERHLATGTGDFSYIYFRNRVDFKNRTFERANFFNATFSKRANFAGATFSKLANFGGATFSEGADFTGATFSEGAGFVRATFKMVTVFEGSSQRALFDGAVVDFRDVTLDPLASLAFRNADLSGGRFLNTDVRNIEFTSVKWCRTSSRWPGKGTVCVYDEECYDDDEMPWGHLERLYRELKQNYEDRRDYARAGDFHFRQKEMRKHNPDTPAGHKGLLWLYWAVSGYGERIWPAVAWFVAIVFGCAALYLWAGIDPAGPAAPLTWSGDAYGSALLYSAQTSFLMQPDGYALEAGAQWVRLVQTVVSPILLGLIALAIRQRLKR